MQFLYPTFLFALAALAIPVILHLFYFRPYKKVYFTNVRFLREVKEETSARSRLRNLLVLLMRLLAFTFLVLMFAQPFIPQDVEVSAGRKAVSVFVDNSFSMSALSQDVPLLEKAKQRAREVVEAYSPEDQFQIITNDFEGRRQRLVSQEDALSLIDEVQKTPAVRQLSEVLSRQQQALNLADSDDNQLAYLISDFQQNITDLQTYQDTTLDINLVPLQAVQENNVSIDSAWFEAPVQMQNQSNQLLVKIENLGETDAENIRLSIRYEGQTKPVGTLTVPANGSVTDTVNISVLRTGWHEAELSITDYPVQFDDNYYFTFEVAEQINVLAINGSQPNRYLQAAFGGMTYFQLNNQPNRNLDYSAFPSYQMIILNELENISSGLAFELKQYAQNGGNLLVFPAPNANIDSYREFLTPFPADEPLGFEEQARQVGQVNTEEFVFRDVFENRNANLKLPATQGNYRMRTYESRKAEPLLTYRSGDAFLTKYRINGGHLYWCSAPLQTGYNDLVQNGEIFIPMLYKMAISSARKPKIAYTIGEDEVIEADHQPTSAEIVYKLRGAGGEFIPEQRVVGPKVFLGLGKQVQEAGYYELFLNPEKPLARYAFNYDRQESDLTYYNSNDLEDRTGPNFNVLEVLDTSVLTARIEERSQGVTLWRYCLILALAFLAAEVLILRLWKV